MAKTSIHIKACNIASSELHNKREKKLSYIRQELTPLNESFNYTGQSLATELNLIHQDVKKHTHRKLQKNAVPIKEGVAVISDTTTMEDLKNFCSQCQQEFGLVPLQIHIHRDEGHTAAKEWKPNLHAHIVWRMYNNQGRNVRLSNVDCAKMQTILAECLKMERGQASSQKHVDALQYKIEAKTSLVEQLTTEVAELSTTKAVKEEGIKTIQAVGKSVVDMVTGKTLREKRDLRAEISILRAKLTEKDAEVIQVKREAQKAKLDGYYDALEDILRETKIIWPQYEAKTLYNIVDRINALVDSERKWKWTAQESRKEINRLQRELNGKQQQSKGRRL